MAGVTRKVERVLNLLLLLLETRRPLTLEEIRAKIPGYPASDQAFRRAFERDKEELRELGIPVERAPTDAWGVEEGYRVPEERATLPAIDLARDEQAALWLAAQAWGADALPGEAHLALMKLALASRLPDEAADAPWLRARVDASGRALAVLLDAIQRRKRVRFRYRTGGAGEAQERVVDPYALRHRGAWYLAGLDHARGEVRHFKLDRIDGAVEVASGAAPDFAPPEGPVADIPRGPWAGEGRRRARIAFAPEAAWWVERRTGAPRLAEREDGWVELEIPFDDADLLLSWTLGFGDDAVVVSPPDLREEAVARLRRAAGADG
jgi:proteasome accessory factor B